MSFHFAEVSLSMFHHKEEKGAFEDLLPVSKMQGLFVLNPSLAATCLSF